MSFLDKLSEVKSKLSNDSSVYDLIEHAPIVGAAARKLGLTEKAADAANVKLPDVDLSEGSVAPSDCNNGAHPQRPAKAGGSQRDDSKAGPTEQQSAQEQIGATRPALEKLKNPHEQQHFVEHGNPSLESESNPQEAAQKNHPGEPTTLIEHQPGDRESVDRVNVREELQLRLDHERDQFRMEVENLLPRMTCSLPVRTGEDYHQVLKRMFPGMKEGELSTLAHDVETLNGKSVLQAGDRFEILSEFGKRRLTERVISDYEHNNNNNAEGRRRERFSPPYERVTSQFASRIEASAHAAMQMRQKDTFKLPEVLKNELPQRPLRNPDATHTAEPIKTERIYFPTAELQAETRRPKDTTAWDESKEIKKEIIERTEQQQTEVYEALKDFVSACRDLKTQGEMLQFLGKWYKPETNMYNYGLEKYAVALDHVQQASARMKATMLEEHEREQLRSQWREFILKQQRAIAEFRRNLPILGEAYRTRFESNNLVDEI